MKPNNVVLVATISKHLILDMCYEMLTIIETFPKTNWKKIPFFGENGVIVSISYNGKCRGIRKGESQLKNAISLDLQIRNKNVHIMMTKQKLDISGADSYEGGLEAIDIMLEHIKMSYGNWLHFKRCLSSTRDLSIIHMMSEDKSEIPEGIDDRVIDYLSCFLHENIIEKKIVSLLNFSEYDLSDIHLLNVYIANSVYNFKIQKWPGSLDKAYQILTDNGYILSKHNWVSSKTMQAMIPIFKDKEKSECIFYTTSKGKQKIRSHKLLIYSNGTVRLTTSASLEDVNIFEQEFQSCFFIEDQI